VGASGTAAPDAQPELPGIEPAQRAALRELARNLLGTLDRAGAVAPHAPRLAALGLSRLDTTDAYEAAAQIVRLRQARGERVVGWKLGFTNRLIWPIYGVSGPLVGAVWNSTLVELAETEGVVRLGHLIEPRLEPEIVLGLANAPRTADPADVAAAIGWVAHGFEIVQSPYPGWAFSAADAILAGGLHGRLIVGPKVPVATAGGPTRLASVLSGLSLALMKSGQPVAEGHGSANLGGPVQALAYALSMADACAAFPPLQAGDVITTGTLTDAQPVLPGQTWSTSISRAPLPGLTLRFAY
jgi:2-oxo-3-hexenedioate decarboxylase